MAKSVALCLALASVLLLSVPVTFDPLPATAAPTELEWTPVNIPAEGRSGNWQLASGTDVEHLTVARDSTLYAYATPSGTSYTLFKSTSGGETWSPAGQVTAAIVAIAVAPDDASAVYYATSSTVYKSSDGGATFGVFSPGPGGAGSNNITITSIAIASAGSRIIAVGTRDRDSAQFGGVYTVNESALAGGWVDTGIGNYDVLAVAFSPDYAADRQLIAVATNETDTLVAFRRDATAWGSVSGNATISGVVPAKATVALPGDYNATFFLAIDTGGNNGDVFRIERRLAPNSSNVTDLNIATGDNLTGIDVTGLAVSGSNSSGYYLLAGAAASNRVYVSADGGQSWSRSAKEPTGQSKIHLSMAPDFVSSRRAYAVTSGAGSAFSYSVDGGITWNQLSLIDTSIAAIVDMAVSPKYGQDGTMFLLTWSGEHSLWRSRNGGVRWERVFTGTLAGASSLTHLELSPQYGTGEPVVFLAGGSGGQWAIWKSRDNGQTFSRRLALFPIDVLTVVGNDSLFIGSYNGTSGLVYGTLNGGVSYSTPTVVGNQPLKSLVLSPGYAQDKTVLAGNANGWVYWSADNGTSFEPLPSGAIAPPLTGNIFVAFDPGFRQSRVVYVASDNVATSSSRDRIYRFIVGESRRWESIDSTVPVGSKFSQLSLFSGGTLYAVNSMANGGMERSLNPASPTDVVCETASQGLTDNATLNGLWTSGNQLWSIDTRNSRLMTYIDSLTVPAALISPGNNAPGVATRNTFLEWEPLSGATEYHWQVDYGAGFATVPSVFEGDSRSGSTRLPVLEMATTYYWRVRVTKPLLSPWSAARSFTTVLGAAGITPELYSPKSGATEIPRRPVLQWSSIAGAERYELLVSSNASFSNPIIAKIGADALPTTAWQSDVSLDYETTYFWKIRGVSSNSYSSWSAVGTFTTVSAPLPPPPPAPPPAVVIVAPELYSPRAGGDGVPLKPIFQWGSTTGAERYELLVSTNASFSNAIIAKTGADALTVTAWQSDIVLDYDTTYYWKIRAGNADSFGAWSTIGAFTTVSPPVAPLPSPPPSPPPPPPAPAPALPLQSPELNTPKTGASGVVLKPVFQWGAVAGAGKYELLVAGDVSFSSPVIVRIGGYALPATAWQSEVELDYDTTYFWKVRAIGTDNSGEWSPAGVFTTVSAPLLAVSSSPSPPPAQPVLPSWALYFGIGLLVIIGLLLVTILILVVTMRHY